MSWETRERGGPYYTRTRRVNGHQIREYVGGGILGQEAAEIDAEERERREAELLAMEPDQASCSPDGGYAEGIQRGLHSRN